MAVEVIMPTEDAGRQSTHSVQLMSRRRSGRRRRREVNNIRLRTDRSQEEFVVFSAAKHFRSHPAAQQKVVLLMSTLIGLFEKVAI